MLQSMEAHRAGHNLATEQEQQSYLMLLSSVSVLDFFIETKQMGCVCVCVHAHSAVSASLQPHGLYVAHQAPLLTDKSKSPQIMF